MGFEYLRIKNFDGQNWVEMLSMDYRKQIFIRNYPDLDKTKFKKVKPQGCPCPEIEYMEKSYFNKLESKYNELRNKN